MAAQPSARVAISADFLDAFAEIPRSQQAKVRRFIEMFKTNPTAPGINYEKISNFRDPKLRSIRIDQSYRGIVLKPDSGDVYMLLWVAHHDDAYQWAANKLYSIHPDTGGLQVVDTEQVEQAQPAPEDKPEEAPDLFASHRDRELTRLGIPLELIPLIRSVRSEAALDAIQPHLPEEAYEALFMLAAGYTPSEVDREMAALRQSRDKDVDTEDYEAALENPDTQRRFQVVGNELELAEILDAPLEKWRVFLHPSQRQLVRMEANGPVRVLGGAGTGKTVVAMHRAKHLVENVFDNPEQRLLFTTFTRNLAADIESNLKKICSPEVLAKIEVVNLDRWVNEFLQRQGYEYRIDYGKVTEELWDDAVKLAPDSLGLPRAFYREEWDQVVQPHEVVTLADYLRVPRTGRGTRLSRSQRNEIWPVFEEYFALLNEKQVREPDGAMRDARMLLEKKGQILPYRAIVVDEAQDLGRQAFMLIRSMVPEQPQDLFIVGDAHQRIYRHPIVLSRCGVDIVGRGRQLRINYRTTEETRRWAVGLLTGVTFDDLDGGSDSHEGYKSLLSGLDPEEHHFESFAQEVRHLVDYLSTLSDQDLRRTCLVARKNSLVDQYEGALRAGGIPTYQVRREQAEDRSSPGVRLATMHRVKGLEFERVIIASANDGVVPLPQALASAASDAELKMLETRERSLLYVAATRARQRVMITSFGTASPLLERTDSSS